MARGYSVEFVTGPVADANLPAQPSHSSHAKADKILRVHRVTSAAEMLEKAGPFFDTADLIIFAAAVADYAPAETLAEKMAKSEELILHLESTPDIARTLCAQKRNDQIAIGFALQTIDGEANARRKLETKNLDGIVLNTPTTLGAGKGTFSFLSRHAELFNEWGCIDKGECARKILDEADPLTGATCNSPPVHPKR